MVESGSVLWPVLPCFSTYRPYNYSDNGAHCIPHGFLDNVLRGDWPLGSRWLREKTQGLLLTDWSASWLHDVRARERRRKGKELHVGLAYVYAHAIETKDPSVIEDRWPGHRYVALFKRGKWMREEEKEEKERKGRTDENATGKSYRDTANPRHGTWATVLHLRARVCVYP